MQACVELPPDLLINYWSFCKAIAQALCPTNESHFVGVECIVEKTITRHTVVASAPGNGQKLSSVELQRVLISEDGATLDQLIFDESQGGESGPLELPLVNSLNKEVIEASFPYPITEEDRRLLKGLLPNLPPLRYPISDEERGDFLDAYCRLKDRPAWEPVLVGARYIEQKKEMQAALSDRHKKALQEEFAAGRIAAVDAQHVPVAALGASSFIPRNHAIAYLERCGLNWNEEDSTSNLQRADSIAELAALKSLHREAPISSSYAASDEMPRLDTADDGVGKKLHPADAEIRPALSFQSVPPPEIKSVGKVARVKRVEELTGLKRSSIYNRMDERSAQYDPTFPRSFALGAQPGSGVGWDEDKIKAWVAARAASSFA